MNTARLNFAFVDLVHASSEDGTVVRATEAKVRDASVGCRNDAVNATGLIANLDAQARGNVEATIAIHLHSVCGTVVHTIRAMTLPSRQTL